MSEKTLGPLPTAEASPSPVSEQRFAESYQKILHELEALPESACLPVRLDIQSAAMSIMGTVPEVMLLRPRVLVELPRFDITRIDNLSTYAGAAWHAHTLYQMADKPPATVADLAGRAVHVRDLVVADLGLLVKRGLIPEVRLKAFQGGSGYRAVASDLTLGVNLLRENGDTVKGRTTVTAPELDEAEMLARVFVTAVAEREQAPAKLAQAVLNRQRAYTLMVNCYDQVRRVVTYLRWDEGDVDEIVDSLWAGRTASALKDEAEELTPAPAQTTASSTPSSNTANAPRIPVGLPGSEPFLPSRPSE